MDENNNSIALLHSILQPRSDWFALTHCYPVLKEVIHALIHTGDNVWDINELHALHEQIENNTLDLPSTEGLGPKGIYGSYPIHGATYNLSTKGDEYEKRAWLLSHVITAAYQWRTTLEELEERLDTPESHQAHKNKKIQYQSQLENACKVVRLIKKDRLDMLLSSPTKTDKLHAHLTTLTPQHKNADVEEISNRYIKDLERFFAYAFNIRPPKKRQQEVSPEKNTTTKKVRLSLSLDSDPDIEQNDASGKQIHFLETTEGMVNDDGAVITVDRQDEIRNYGLSLLEERACVEAFQSHQSVSPARGDSTQQAILRSRAQLQYRAKSAQLLPERWEQLSTFDIQCLRRAIDTLGSRMPRTLTSVVMMVLVSGRPLEHILDAHVVECTHDIPEALRDNIVYFASQERTWTAKTIRPEGRRQVKSDWKSLMRNTDNRLTHPLPPFFWQLVKHPIEIASKNFNHRSVPLFSDAKKKEYMS